MLEIASRFNSPFNLRRRFNPWLMSTALPLTVIAQFQATKVSCSLHASFRIRHLNRWFSTHMASVCQRSPTLNTNSLSSRCGIPNNLGYLVDVR